MSQHPQSPLTVKRIAHSMGVSATTVSRVLSGKAKQYRISDDTAAQIEAMAKRNNFTPNAIARGLRLLKTNTIGLLIPDISNPFFAALARHVTEGLRRQGYSIILCDSQDDLTLEKQSLDLLWNRQVDGMILVPIGQTSEHLSQYPQLRKPTVLVDRFFPKLGLPFVSSDNFMGAQQAMEYFFENGHSKIACLKGLGGTAPAEERLRGYREALRGRGLSVDESLICGDAFGEQSGYLEMKLLLSRRRDFTAVFAMSNLLAAGALSALREDRVRVPEDISMIAFDEQPYLAHFNPPLTTISQNVERIGETVVRLLMQRIRTPELSNQEGIFLPTALVQRKSVSRVGPPILAGRG